MRLGSIARVLLLVGAAFVASDAAAEPVQIDIPAQDLGGALVTFSRQTNLQVLVSAETTRGVQAPKLSGKMEPDAALRALLGDGFRFEFTNPKTVVVTRLQRDSLRAAPAPRAVVASEPPPEEVIVTGSRLRRAVGEGASPTTVVTQAAIERSGAGTVRDLLNIVPQASVTPGEINGFLGTAPIQLRGLSIGTTLVLVDGQRVAPSAANGRTFNIASIPLSAVKRVEIVADGASAIYGADAIGGIVNVILKDDLDAPEVELRYGAGRGGTPHEERATALWGYRGDRFRTSFVFDYFNRSDLLYKDRNPSSDMNYTRFGGTDFRLPYTNQGTVSALSGNLPGLSAPVAAIPQNVTGPLTPASFLATQGQSILNSDYYAGRQLAPATKRYGLLSNSTVDLTDSISAYLSLVGSEEKGRFVLVQPFLFSGLPVPASNPYNPFGVPVGVDRLLTGVAPDTLSNRDLFYRAVGGIRGTLGGIWKWDLSARYARDLNRATEENVLDFGAIASALSNPDPQRALNPFAAGPVGSPELLRSLLPRTYRRYDAKEYGFAGTIDGKLFQLPAGPLQLVFGFETARDSLATSSALDVNNSARTAASVYSEMLVPITSAGMAIPGLRALDLSVALRYDHYSDFGGTTNPKVGLEWTVLDGLRLRGTFGTSFKAPSLFDLSNVPVTAPSTLIDRRRNGQLTNITLLAGGNRNLQPEQARTYNVGASYSWKLTPGAQLTLGVDRWWVHQTQRIVSPDPQVFVDNESLFGSRIVRAAPSPADLAAGLPGAITNVDATSINFGRSQVEGEDLRAAYDLTLDGGANFGINLTATHVDTYRAELLPGSVQNHRGVYAAEGFAPSWKGNATILYGTQIWEASLTARYVGSYRDLTQPSAPYSIPASTFFDAQFSYAPPELEGLRVRVGATNLFDRSPPFFNGSRGYDSLEYDNVGRFLYVQISKRF
jgi:iron complex outermembrane recepter protein